MGTFYEILFMFRENVKFLSILVSGMAFFLEIVGLLEKGGYLEKKKVSEKIRVKFSGKFMKRVFVSWVIIIVVGGAAYRYAEDLVRVPTVTGKLYSDAKNILIEHDLEFYTIQGHEGCKVEEQSPEAGTVVEREKKVLMLLEECTGLTATNDPNPTIPYSPTPTATNTPVPTATNTPVPTATNTPVPTATNTPVPTTPATQNTPVPTKPQEPTLTPTVPPTPTPINTPTPPPHEHDYTWKVKTVKEADCISEGKIEHVCECGDYWTETVPMLRHSLVTDDAVAATCTSSGKTEGSHCATCGTVLVAQIPIAAKGHNEVTVTGKSATCTTTGETDGKKCSVCETVTIAQTIIMATGHKYDDDSDAYCNNCNEYRATWHYYDQWDNDVYSDWELYKTEQKETVKTETVTTYTYRVYYWVDSTKIGNERYRATGPKLLPSTYTFNKYLTEDEVSNYAGITTGTDTYITLNTNKKYNILQSQVFYSPQGYVSGSGCIINGVNYWEEVIGSEEKQKTYMEYHYFFRKYY